MTWEHGKDDKEQGDERGIAQPWKQEKRATIQSTDEMKLP